MNIKGRIYNHCNMLRRDQHRNIHLQSAWNKYGESSFSFSTMLICRQEDLICYEQRAIDAYWSSKTLYNISSVAGSRLGVKHSAETLAHFKTLPQLRAGKILSRETRAAISAGLMGHKVSDAHRAAFIARCKGKKLSPEHRAKLALAKIGKKQDPLVVAKRAASNSGKKRSEETKNRMFAAQILRLAKERG